MVSLDLALVLGDNLDLMRLRSSGLYNGVTMFTAADVVDGAALRGLDPRQVRGVDVVYVGKRIESRHASGVLAVEQWFESAGVEVINSDE